MKNMKLLILTSLLMLSACVEESEAERVEREQKRGVQIEPQSSVTVKRITKFYDDIAYNGTRAIYLITDEKTGKEFIGISGIGITEVGSHSSGKSTVRDER